MAVSGLFFALFVLAHMYGNLKILAGHEQFDSYAHHLRTMGEPILPYSGMLWIFRILLLAALAAHLYSAFTLWGRANHARQQKYLVKDAMHTAVSSRTMRWGGVALLLFIVFHLFQFTFRSFYVGTAPVSSPAAMVVAAFSTWWLTLIYVLAMIALGLHLHHGVWSACQTLGFTNSAKARGMAKLAGAVVAGLVVLGFLIPPLAIQFGLIK